MSDIKKNYTFLLDNTRIKMGWRGVGGGGGEAEEEERQKQ